MENLPKAYQWTFDRNPWDSVADATRLSVGVYQWLPTISGQGLKRSKSIRIHGYVADSARVYGKARGLCLRLNAEKIRAENPPKWLQKSYSVPRPPEVTLGRFSDGLTGAKVRSVREKVMRSLLIPQGFVKGNGGTYIRKTGQQIHLIDFQANKYGGSYFVNLAFHYSFLPPFLHQKPIDLRAYHQLDCGIRDRIGCFMPTHESDFQYGHDVEVLKSTFASNVDICLGVFEKFGKKWENPERWLSKISSTGKFDERSVAPWGRMGKTQLFTICIALHLGKFDVAQRQIERIRPAAPESGDVAWIEHYNQIIRIVAGNDRYQI